MGLDMYLYKVPKMVVNKMVAGKLSYAEFQDEIVEIGYWRKANQIHRWFIDNVQNKVDDCGYYEVSLAQLEKLHDLIKKILKDNSKADELLPTSSGFYFGETDYDEYYFEQLEDTLEVLENALTDVDETKFKVVYSSSW